MAISEEADDQDEEDLFGDDKLSNTLYRKLDYENSHLFSSPSQKKITRLNFSPMPASSMKKKVKVLNLNTDTENGTKTRELFKVIPVVNGAAE